MKMKIRTLTNCAVLEYMRRVKQTTGDTRLEAAYVEVKQELDNDNPMWLPNEWYGKKIYVEIVQEEDDYYYVTENNNNYYWLPKIFIEQIEQ